jgi:hypothetical protein
MKRTRKSKASAPKRRLDRERGVKTRLARGGDQEVQAPTEGSTYMRVPGFTAAAALYDRPGQYRAGETFEGRAGAAQVVPQACVNIGPCRVCVTVRIGAPRACLTFSCLGFNRSFCVP